MPTYQEEYYKQYYYHGDHLGSASLISDYKGDEYQRIEYTPYGETWVEKTQNTGLEFLTYKFTAKELDKETGLYYYGARYLDPKYSRWISTDPALGEYIPKASTDEEAKRHNQNLPGMGGVYNTVNASLYHYAGNNPVKYTDPDGRDIDAIFEVTRYEQTKDGWTAFGNLTLTNNDFGASISIDAYSGGKGRDFDGVSLPIPLGEYDILEQKQKDGYFRLEAKDSNYGNDNVDGIETPQNLLRLHYQGATYGCLSVKAKGGKEFDKIKDFIKSTSTSTSQVTYKGRIPFKNTESIKNYGNLKVIQGRNIQYRDIYAPDQYKQEYTHQRMK